MHYEQVISLLAFALVFYGSPGPATLSLAASGSAVGFRRSLPYTAGIVAGVLVNFVVSTVGIAALMEAAPTVVTVMKYASFAYIVVLAVRMARFEPRTGSARPPAFHDGVVLNLLNPKAYIAAFAVLSQFGGGRVREYTRLVVIVVGTTIVVDLAWCYAGAVLGDVVSSPRRQRWLRIGFSVLLVVSVLFATFGS